MNALDNCSRTRSSSYLEDPLILSLFGRAQDRLLRLFLDHIFNGYHLINEMTVAGVPLLLYFVRGRLRVQSKRVGHGGCWRVDPAGVGWMP